MGADRLGPVGRKGWIGAVGLFVVHQRACIYGPVTDAQVFDMKRQLAADMPKYVPHGEGLLISRMQSYNFPNRDVYESYRVMMLPNDPIVPPSRHSAGILKPFDPGVTYYLLGSGTPGLPCHGPGPYPALVGGRTARWRCPAWARGPPTQTAP